MEQRYNDTLSNKQKYTDAINEAIQTNSEARMCRFYMEDFDWSEYLRWKYEILENHCKSILWR